MHKPPLHWTTQSPGFGRGSSPAGAGRYSGVQAHSAADVQRTLPFQPQSTHAVPSALHAQRGPSASDGAWTALIRHVPLAGSNEHASATQGELVAWRDGAGPALEAGVSRGSLLATARCAIGGGAVAAEVDGAVEGGAFGLVHATTRQLARQ